ncbi:MAG: YiiX/YebB-like N1pC/P60 family cysteine hydrolase [Pyrinomonadaceae bacterium]
MNTTTRGKKDLIARFLTVFGDFKVFKWPLFFLYDPGSYLVKGEDMREVLRAVKPGDILLRGYTNYLDGYFIPGYFSHVGLFLGKVDKDSLDSIWSNEYTPLDHVKTFCRSGEQMVIHSMAEGVFMEDLLNFCRCDYMAILRFPEQLKGDNAPPPQVFDADLYNSEENEIEGRLKRGEVVRFEEVFPIMYKLALSQLGRDYDFRFNFKSFDTFSCSELLYYCAKSLCWHLSLWPTEKKALLFFKKNMLEPDAYARCTKLNLVWLSKSGDQNIVSEMRKEAAASPPARALSSVA